MRYFTNAGPDRGPLLYARVPGAIGVLEALDKPMPIGTALGVGWDGSGRALWRLTVGQGTSPVALKTDDGGPRNYKERLG
jgi:hypothetical protein